MLKDAIKLANKVMALADDDYESFAEILQDKQRGQAESADEEKPKRRRRRKKAAEPTPEQAEEAAAPEKPKAQMAHTKNRKPRQKTIDEAISSAKDPLDEALEGVL